MAACIIVTFTGTYDLQDVSTSMERHLLKVTCHFARGATARRCMLVLKSDNGTVSLERLLSLSNNTDCTTTQSCSVHTIFNLLAHFIVGNVSVIVSGFENGVVNVVYIRELTVEVFDLRTEVMNSTSSNNTTEVPLTTPGKCASLLIKLKELITKLFSYCRKQYRNRNNACDNTVRYKFTQQWSLNSKLKFRRLYTIYSLNRYQTCSI